MLDPWLGGLGQTRIEPAAERVIREAARGLADRYWRSPNPAGAPAAPSVPGTLGYDAAFRTLTSTAAVIAHDRIGRVAVSRAMAEEARRRLMAFVGLRGFRALVAIYVTISRFEHLGMLGYHGGVSEEEFVHGRHRRPWVDTPLDADLERGVADGDFRISTRDGVRWVEQTPLGAQRYAEIRRTLAEARFFEARLRLALFSEMNLVRDYEGIRRRMVPREVDWRRAFTAFVGIRPGARVLEVGCTTGVQVFDGGLLEAVGPTGHVTGLCPSIVLMDQARAKAQRQHAKNVRFVRSFFEELPFPDRRFDVTLGVALLHRADARRAVAEMVRVTRPGGTVAHGTSCDPDDPPAWLREWLAPVLSRAGARVGRHPHARPRLGEVARWFAEAGLVDVQTERQDSQTVFDDPEGTAMLILRTDPTVQEALGGLPWRAAEDLIDEMTQRARDIFPRLTPEERRMTIPVESVRGRVPEALRGQGPAAALTAGAGDERSQRGSEAPGPSPRGRATGRRRRSPREAAED